MEKYRLRVFEEKGQKKIVVLQDRKQHEDGDSCVMISTTKMMLFMQ
jgi:hypothetical protein